MDDGTPTLEVGFAIDTGGSFDELTRLQNFMGSTEAKVVAEATKIERATGGMVKLGGATAQVISFGNAASRELANVARETARAEKSGESMARQLQRQAETFGKSASEIRNMRAEMRALEAEQRGLTELAGRIRGLNAEMNRLETSASRVGPSMGGTRAAMQGLSFQAQDAFTQISMGTNVLSVLAIQGGQAAGQMTYMGGTLGKVANFMIGPWGLAITAGLLVLGSLTKGMFDNEEATKRAVEAMKAFQDRQSDIGNFIDLTTGKIIEQNRELVINAILLRQRSIAENEADISAGRKAAFKAASSTRVSTSLVGSPVAAQMVDPDVQKAIQAAGGDVDKLAVSIFNLAQTKRPDLKGLALDISSQAGQAILAQRENEKLGKELRALSGDTSALASNTTALINKQVALTTATTPLARARAQLALVEQGASAADKAGGAALVKYRDDLTAATTAVHAAEAAERARSAARRDSTKATREAESELKKQQRLVEAATKGANDYIAAQEKDTARMGKSAKEIRLMEDAVRRLNAPLEAQKLKLDEVAAAREAAYSEKAATDFQANVIKPLRDELALYGLVGPARAAAALELEKEAFIAKNMDDGIGTAMQRWRDYYQLKKELVDKDTAAEREVQAIKRMADEFERMLDVVDRAGDGFARAFGAAGAAIADVTHSLADYMEQQKKIDSQVTNKQMTQAMAVRQSGRLQIATYGDMAEAAKGFFGEGSKGYRDMQKAEQAFRTIQFALSVRAIAQDALETGRKLVTSGLRTAQLAVEAVVKAISSLPFPLNLVAGAATAGAIAALGVSIAGSFGAGGRAESSNTGTGTVFGDSDAKSESIKRSIDALKDVDTVMLSYSRQMAASLQSIESQIGGFANVLVRNADSINASGGVPTGFQNSTGKIAGATIGAGAGMILGGPVGALVLGTIGKLVGSLFGSRYDVTGSGISGGPQSVGSIMNGGFDASYFSDVQKTKKFFGVVTGRSTSTQFSNADPALENQFTLILRQFNDAIAAAAGPLGESTTEIQRRLNGFVVNIGKIDLKGLTGEQIQEKLGAVFGAAADNMANAAFPGLTALQKVGEGAFETLVRVASTLEAVGASLDLLGQSAQGMGNAAKLGLADQFESVPALTSATDAYFQSFYTKEEQAAARTAQMGKVFASLGMSMPASLAAFRHLVEAQNLTTTAGQATYATLLKLAPAFADLQASMEGAKSAADIASERQDLERKLLELRGDTAALRALELAKLDASNRALQQQIWAIQDAQEAAKAADELRKAWQSVGDSILNEVNRIRGITGTGADGGFATLLGQFNASSTAARGGDMDAAKSLPGLSQALLSAAALVATSRQELDRVQAQTAASLEATNAAIRAANAMSTAQTNADLLAAGATTQASNGAGSDNTAADLRIAFNDLRKEMAQMRAENNAGHAATAGNTGKMARVLDNVTHQSGGDAIATVAAA